MDISTLTFVGLIAVGTVNVLSFFYPNMDSKMKFGFSFLFALGAAFIPADMGNIILNKAKLAIEAALFACGAFKLTQNAGGK
jgi:hypothetical protein